MRTRKISRYPASTYIFPSRLDNVLEVDTGGKPDGAILRGLEDKIEEVGEETRLSTELLEVCLGLFSCAGVE